MKGYAGKILMVVQSLFPHDHRIALEALKLTENNYKVTVICLSEYKQKRLERWNGVSVYRIPALNIFNKTETQLEAINARSITLLRSSIGYLVEYLYFT
ncbi:MAG: hypothetical protein ACFFDT_39715, partial [Candidatus Hodarchaeota archaeon]